MKIFKSISLCMISVLLALCTVFYAGAETVYQYYGFSYTLVDNYSISLVGWDNRSDSFTLPYEVNERKFISVGNYALEGNTELRAIDLSQATKLNRIGMNAFYGCTGLDTEFIIPESVTIINECAFQGCSSLPKVVINANITEIPNQCFLNCSSLAEVNIPDTVETINPWAFAKCTSLEYIEIPASVKSIAQSAFANDANLTLGVWYGTAGYDYAVAQNIPYVLLDEVKLGDANGDGYVNVNDVTAIQRHAAELEPLEGICFHAADVDGDGDVSVDDATELQRYLAEYAVDYPVGEKLLQ